MKVVFLCGGAGKRMLPITEDKFLLSFLGRTLLEHQIETARKAGLDRFLVIASPANRDQIEQITRGIPAVKIELALQKEPLGIGDALKSAASFLDGEILVVNPNDVIGGSAYTRLLEERRKEAAASYILGYEVKDYFPGGYLDVDSASHLRHIVEKPEPGREPGRLVNILVHLHTQPGKLLESIRNVQTARDDVYECALDNLVKEGATIKVAPYTGFWAPVKYPWHILDATRHLLAASEPRISASASLSGKAIIEGKVIIGDNVRVLENAVIRGPAYIGPNSIIGNNVLVRDHSHIGAGCVVGFSTEVKGSYIGDGCWFHSCYVGDSVIGNGCSFGAGTVMANFRFDEKNIWVNVGGQNINTGRDKLGSIIGNNCRTGINASIMPGRRIGPNSIVGSHVCLIDDLGPDKIVTAEPHYRFFPNRIRLDSVRREGLRKKLGGLEGEP